MSTYDDQAIYFLSNNGLTFRATKSKANKPAPWTPSGNRYNITIKGEDRRLSFPFWGSVNDREQGTDPSPYSVLACISGDIHCPDTFGDFCAEYGMDEDSRKALALFNRCSKFAAKLRAFFTRGEIEQLGEIN